MKAHMVFKSLVALEFHSHIQILGKFEMELREQCPQKWSVSASDVSIPMEQPAFHFTSHIQYLVHLQHLIQ